MEDKRIEQARGWVELMESKDEKQWVRGNVLDGIEYVSDLLSKVEELEKERKKYEFWYETTKKTLVEAEINIEELQRRLEKTENQLVEVMRGSEY